MLTSNLLIGILVLLSANISILVKAKILESNKVF